MNSYEVLTQEISDSEVFEDECFNDIDKLNYAEILQKYADNFPYEESYSILQEFGEDILVEGLTGDILNVLVDKVQKLFPDFQVDNFNLKKTLIQIFSFQRYLMKFVNELSHDKVYKYHVDENKLNDFYNHVAREIFNIDHFVLSFRIKEFLFDILKNLGYMGEFKYA